MSEFKIKYGRGRFPVQQKRPDGTLGCRGCGSAIPKGRHTWCSNACVQKHDPARIKWAAKARDKEICAWCGWDYKAEVKKWHAEKAERSRQFEEAYRLIDSEAKVGWWRANYGKSPHMLPYPPPIEYDHIVPFSEGGLTVLENIRTLCHDCHAKRTAEWRRSKKTANLQPCPNLISARKRT